MYNLKKGYNNELAKDVQEAVLIIFEKERIMPNELTNFRAGTVLYC
jgi:hypothetical protein